MIWFRRAVVALLVTELLLATAPPRNAALDRDATCPSEDVADEPISCRPGWITLRLASSDRGVGSLLEIPPIDDRPATTPPELRERPTLELLRQVSFPLGKARPAFELPFELPFRMDLEAGQSLRDDDVVRSAVKIDRRLLLSWVPIDQMQMRLEAGYSVTYLSGQEGATSYLRHGPCGGLVFEF